jgi:prevent-host-death family protein
MVDQQELGVAEAKRRFSELVERVARGERFLISRRGKPVVALVHPREAVMCPQPLGLAAMAGALAEWEDLEETVAEIYASRRRARDRKVRDLE